MCGFSIILILKQIKTFYNIDVHKELNCDKVGKGYWNLKMGPMLRHFGITVTIRINTYIYTHYIYICVCVCVCMCVCVCVCDVL